MLCRSVPFGLTEPYSSSDQIGIRPQAGTPDAGARQNQLATFRTFLLVSCGLSAAGLLTVLALITLLSGRIIRPFVDNYEKQRRFITDAGHELKTPLAIIEAATEDGKSLTITASFPAE